MFFTCFGKSKVPKRYSTLYRELIESALVHPLRIFAFHHAFPLHFCSISTVVFTSPSHTYFLCLEKRKKKKEEMFDHVFLVHLRRRLPISLQSQNIQSPPSVLAAGPNNHLRFSSTRQNISCCGPPPAPPQPSRQTGKLRFRGRASGKTNRTWK